MALLLLFSVPSHWWRIKSIETKIETTTAENFKRKLLKSSGISQKSKKKHIWTLKAVFSWMIDSCMNVFLYINRKITGDQNLTDVLVIVESYPITHLGELKFDYSIKLGGNWQGYLLIKLSCLVTNL